MSLLHPFLHKFASYMWYIYICPKRTYSCMQRMRGQQVHLRERIPNAMFVTLSTYFYVGARMLNYSCKRCCIYERRFRMQYPRPPCCPPLLWRCVWHPCFAALGAPNYVSGNHNDVWHACHTSLRPSEALIRPCFGGALLWGMASVPYPFMFSRGVTLELITLLKLLLGYDDIIIPLHVRVCSATRSYIINCLTATPSIRSAPTVECVNGNVGVLSPRDNVECQKVQFRQTARIRKL